MDRNKRKKRKKKRKSKQTTPILKKEHSGDIPGISTSLQIDDIINFEAKKSRKQLFEQSQIDNQAFNCYIKLGKSGRYCKTKIILKNPISSRSTSGKDSSDSSEKVQINFGKFLQSSQFQPQQVHIELAAPPHTDPNNTSNKTSTGTTSNKTSTTPLQTIQESRPEEMLTTTREDQDGTVTTSTKAQDKIFTLIRPKTVEEEKKDQRPQRKVRKGARKLQSKLIINEVRKGTEDKKQDFDSNTKVIIIENENVAQILEEKPFEITWCSICNKILPSTIKKEIHISSKAHQKIKRVYGLTAQDDQNCIILFHSVPGDITDELSLQRLRILKKRLKKMRVQLAQNALRHDSLDIYGKEYTSPKKQYLLRICCHLDRLIQPHIQMDYESIDNKLQELMRILMRGREADLHIMRQSKFISLLIAICKKVVLIHKGQLNELIKVIDSTIRIMTMFCGLVQNRKYLILTNRIVPLIDLLLWCLNKPMKFVYSLSFLPQLFTVLSIHIRHRMQTNYNHYKNLLVEYIFCSGLFVKLKSKFQSFNSGLDLTTAMGKVPLALLKSITFLETITNYAGFQGNGKPIFEGPKITENIKISLQETDIVGIITLIGSILLQGGSIDKIKNNILPQTIVSLTMTSIRFLNNVARLDLTLLQLCLSRKEFLMQLYHIFDFLLTYCTQHFDKSQDYRDLLNEVILLIGYFTVLNPKNQQLLSRGDCSIIQKLTENVPVGFVMDRKLKDVLFPTIICAVFQNQRNLKILSKFMSMQMIVNYIKGQREVFKVMDESSPKRSKTKEKHEETKESMPDVPAIYKLPPIQKLNGYISEVQLQQYQNYYISYLQEFAELQFQKTNSRRSVSRCSISSTASSCISVLNNSVQNYMFPLRFPIHLWGQAQKFFGQSMKRKRKRVRVKRK